MEKARHVLLLREKLQEQNKTHELTKLDKEASNMSKKGRLLKEKVSSVTQVVIVVFQRQNITVPRHTVDPPFLRRAKIMAKRASLSKEITPPPAGKFPTLHRASLEERISGYLFPSGAEEAEGDKMCFQAERGCKLGRPCGVMYVSLSSWRRWGPDHVVVVALSRDTLH